jgi:hypothetical protein
VVESREQLLARVLKRALVTPVSLALLTGSAVCAFVPEVWMVTALGLVVELGVLQLFVRDANFVRAVREEEQRAECDRQAERIARVRRAVDWETAEMLGRIQSLQERLFQANGGEEAPGARSRVSSRFGASLGQVTGLVERCLQLAEKRHQLRTYLDLRRPPELQRQASQLEAKLEAAMDPVARQLYTQALEQKRGELENYCAIQQAVQRIDGQLDNIECSFGNLLGKLIRLKSADEAHLAVAQNQVSRELTELGANLAALESSVNEMLALETRA